MSLVVNTNMASLKAQQSLSKATMNINKSMEKLSTGYKINSASDDAAGLTIASKLESQFRGADVAKGNAQSAINLLQTADGDLSVIQDNLQRVRDLSVQAANDSNSTAERDAIIKEVQSRFSEINRLADSSSFNGIKLLDGSENAGLVFQIGANSAAATNQMTAKVFGSASITGLNIAGTAAAKLTNAASAGAWIAQIDKGLKAVSDRRSSIGSIQNRLSSAMDSLTITSQNLQAAHSNVKDVDIAKESSAMLKNQILQQASASLLAQANQAPGLATSLI